LQVGHLHLPRLQPHVTVGNPGLLWLFHHRFGPSPLPGTAPRDDCPCAAWNSAMALFEGRLAAWLGEIEESKDNNRSRGRLEPATGRR
jgi:hypothetical protein